MLYETSESKSKDGLQLVKKDFRGHRKSFYWPYYRRDSGSPKKNTHPLFLGLIVRNT